MEVQSRIVEGATELFFRYGLKSITMDDIAKHLGVSKKTIYQFFSDKNQLVCEVTRNYLSYSEKSFEDISEKSMDPVDEILKISEHVKVMFQNMNPSVLYEAQKYYPQAYAIFMEHKESCIRCSLMKNLEQGIELGLYRKDIDLNIISKLRLEQVQMAFNPLIFPSPEYDLAQVQVQFIDHYLHGICTLKGHKLINQYKHISEEE
ncbi:MAG: TetR/AcrR family transcriptional regulator [Cytophagaceae bacterium]